MATRFPWETEQSDPYGVGAAGAGRVNPFAAAAGGVSGGGSPPIAMGTSQPSTGLPQRPSSRQYNALLDPSQRGIFGWLGRVSGLPTREEAQVARIGEARGRAFAKLGELVQQGLPVQQAVLKFVQTPEGMDFLMTDPDPETAMGQFMKQIAPDEKAQIAATRQSVLGEEGDPWGGMRETGTVPTATAPAGPTSMQRLLTPESMAGAAGMETGAPDVAQETPQGVVVPKGITGEKLRAKSRELLKRNDPEGARIMADLAKQYDDLEKPEGLELKIVPDSTSSSGYRFVSEQEALGQPAVGPKPLVEGTKPIDKYYVDRITKEIDEPAAKTTAMRPQMEAFRTALNARDFEPGAAGGLRKAMAKWADFLGIPPEAPQMQWLGVGSAATAELMEASSNYLATQLASEISRSTNLSLSLLASSVPGLLKTRAGNALTLRMMEITAQRNEQLAAYKDRYFAEAESRGESPNMAKLFGELRQLKEAWQPVDKELADEMKRLAKEGHDIPFSGLVEKERQLYSETGAKGKVPYFATLEAMQKWVAEDPVNRIGAQVNVGGTIGRSTADQSTGR